MAATYSSFMTTRFYSPVFNTALFDGPFRIYFSQAYESSALKMYHLLQTEYESLWNEVKAWSQTNKEHIFLLIYPDVESAESIFSKSSINQAVTEADGSLYMQDWEEGVAFGLVQPTEEDHLSEQLTYIKKNLTTWLQQQTLLGSNHVTSET